MRPHLRVAGDPGPRSLVPTTDRFGVALGDIVRCLGCGHMQVSPMPSDTTLHAAYAGAEDARYIEEEAGQRETARRVLSRLDPHAAGGRLVDLGCWVGFLLDEARRAGWETVGVEPSAFASSYARDELGLDVRTEDLLTAGLPDHAFDAVVLGDVIEHLPQPGEALDRIATLLAPEGVLALMLPDAGSLVARALGRRWWSVIPTHVHYFTRRSLTLLLESHGFTVCETTTQPKAFSVAYYLSRVGGYSPPLARALVGAARSIGLADHMWAPDFRDRMLVIARGPWPGDD